jgi:hypothetical protein
MKREEAVEALKTSPFDPNTIGQEIEFVANKLGISIEELDMYMHLPKCTYRDYKSQRQIYDIGAKVMHALGLELGGKR